MSFEPIYTKENLKFYIKIWSEIDPSEFDWREALVVTSTELQRAYVEIERLKEKLENAESSFELKHSCDKTKELISILEQNKTLREALESGVKLVSNLGDELAICFSKYGHTWCDLGKNRYEWMQVADEALEKAK